MSGRASSRKSALLAEAEWLQKNTVILHTKRARPAIRVSAADRDAIEQELKEPVYQASEPEYSSSEYSDASD